jgi:hypothetical protein
MKKLILLFVFVLSLAIVGTTSAQAPSKKEPVKKEAAKTEVKKEPVKTDVKKAVDPKKGKKVVKKVEAPKK